MTKTGKIILLIINIAALVASIFWLLTLPGYDSGVATLVALSALVGLLFVKAKEKDKGVSMSQNAGANSNLYQSNGPMSIK